MHPMKKLLLTGFLLLQAAAASSEPAKDAAKITPPLSNTTSATQDHAQIRNIVASFVQQQTAALPGKVTYQIDEIDQRIVLPKCARLEAFMPTGSQLIGKTSVGVRCPASPREKGNNDSPTHSSGWSIFVPVQIRLSLNLLTSARQLPLGHTLQEQDLASQTVESSQPGGFTDPKQVVGKVLRYSIAAGQVLREDMLRQPYVVTQRQTVQLVVRGNSFNIRSEGVALNNASEGQVVQVRVGSGRVISGVARADGVVEIAP